MLTLYGITHAAIRGKEVERALGFYLGQLGFGEPGRRIEPAQMSPDRLRPEAVARINARG